MDKDKVKECCCVGWEVDMFRVESGGFKATKKNLFLCRQLIKSQKSIQHTNTPPLKSQQKRLMLSKMSAKKSSARKRD